ncbi:ADP-ribosylglycohydrolase [Candidatus Gugararchaeum adminiculabundum]|nr:ADP-ribosylglycohydrolase [Candidatus Gugararchaeum adminiculabundum]
MRKDLKSHFLATLYGAAIGDALGVPSEGLTITMYEKYFPNGIHDFVPSPPGLHGSLQPGQYSDDTEQLLILANSLVQDKGLDIHNFSKRLANWWRISAGVPSMNRGIGKTSWAGCRKLSLGVSPFESGSQYSLSNGSVMRVAPIGLFYRNPRNSSSKARVSSIPTHDKRECKEAAAYIASMISFMVHLGKSPLQAAKASLDMIKDKRLENRFKKAIRYRKQKPEKVAKILGTRQTVLQSVPYAVYCFLHNQTSYEKAVLLAVNSIPGDTDTISCITGALSGAHLGMKGIPKKFIKNLEDQKRIRSLGNKLLSKAAQFGF